MTFGVNSRVAFSILNAGKKILFASLLLSTVAFPCLLSAAEEDDDAIPVDSGDEIKALLKSGDTQLEVSLILGGSATIDDAPSQTIHSPGEAFVMIQPSDFPNNRIAFDESWVNTSGKLLFTGRTSFERGAARRSDDATDIYGGVFDNSGILSFAGEYVNFKDNAVIADYFSLEREPLFVTGRGGAIHNTERLLIGVSGKTTFDSNAVVGASFGKITDGWEFDETHVEGGAIYNAKTVSITGDASFVNNLVATRDLDLSAVVMDTSNWNYESGYNTVYADGGAVYNKGDMTFGGNTEFKNNASLFGMFSRGAGFYNAAEGTVDFNGVTTFEENIVHTAGIYAYGAGFYGHGGTANFNNNVYFKNNIVEFIDGKGEVAAGAGVVAKAGSIVNFNDTASFKENKIHTNTRESLSHGAGLYVSASQVNFAKDALFEGNDIDSSGSLSYGSGAGVYIIDEGQVTFNDSVSFVQNKISAPAFVAGGALANYGTVRFTSNGGSTILFKENEISRKPVGSVSGYTDLQFLQARGGALYNGEGNVIFDKGTKVVFEKNKAIDSDSDSFGGAVYNDVYNDDRGNIYFSGEAVFLENEAGVGGGAIFNKGTLSLSDDAFFQGNKAQKGGAIYNDASGHLTLSGSKVIFKNNIADLGSNIYNLGVLNIENVKDTMDIDYSPYTNEIKPTNAHTMFDQSGDVYNKGVMNIKGSDLQLHTGLNTKQSNKEGTLNIENSRVDIGTSTVYSDTTNIKAGTHLITHIKDGKNGKIAANTIDVSANNTKLNVIVGVGEIQKGESKEYVILDSSNVQGSFFRTGENHLYSVTEKEGSKGVFIVKKLTDGELNEITKNEIVNPYCPSGNCQNYSMDAASAWLDSTLITENEKAVAIQQGLNEIAQIQGLNSQKFQDAMNALTPDTSALINAHAMDLTRQVSLALDNRFYQSIEKTHFSYNGKIHYRQPKELSNLWVQALYSQAEYTGNKSFEMDTVGVIAGIDGMLTDEIRVGAGYTYLMGDGKGMKRDTEIETQAGILYAQYQPKKSSRFYANAFALYGQSTVTENRNVLGHKIESEFDIDVIAAEAKAGYKLGPVVVGNWVSGVLSPEVGLRYVYTKQNEYTDTVGQTVAETDSHTLTGILGAKYTIGYAFSPSIQWYPELRAALTYDFISPETDSNVVLLNGASYSVSSEEMDKFGIEIGLRMGLEIDNRMEFGLEYEGLYKGDYTNHTGKANMKYKF